MESSHNSRKETTIENHFGKSVVICKLWKVINDENFEDIRWHKSGRFFEINTQTFAKNAFKYCPDFFSEQNTLVKFIRRLNEFGFVRVLPKVPDKWFWKFYHKDFTKYRQPINFPLKARQVPIKCRTMPSLQHLVETSLKSIGIQTISEQQLTSNINKEPVGGQLGATSLAFPKKTKKKHEDERREETRGFMERWNILRDFYPTEMPLATESRPNWPSYLTHRGKTSKSRPRVTAAGSQASTESLAHRQLTISEITQKFRERELNYYKENNIPLNVGHGFMPLRPVITSRFNQHSKNPDFNIKLVPLQNAHIVEKRRSGQRKQVKRGTSDREGSMGEIVLSSWEARPLEAGLQAHAKKMTQRNVTKGGHGLG